MRTKFVSRGTVVLAVSLCLGQFASGRARGATVTAAPLTLGWSAASDATVRGYAIYYGRTNQTTTTRVDAGANLSCTVSGLIIGVTYRIYAVSYNAQGVESTASNQLLFTPQTAPSAPRLQIARQSDGSMRLSYQVASNAVCAIQFAAKPNATYWQTLTNVTASQLGDVIATDFSASQVSQRFYRAALSSQPLISGITISRQPNGSMRLDWMTPPGATCQIQSAASPNAPTWTTRATVTANAEGQAAYVDATAASVSTRFYRVAMP
jgi:hypothetical protein